LKIPKLTLALSRNPHLSELLPSVALSLKQIEAVIGALFNTVQAIYA